MLELNKAKFYNKKGMYILEKEYFETHRYSQGVLSELQGIEIKDVKIGGYNNSTGSYWNANINDGEYRIESILGCCSRELLEYVYKYNTTNYTDDEIIAIARKLKFNEVK